MSARADKRAAVALDETKSDRQQAVPPRARASRSVQPRARAIDRDCDWRRAAQAGLAAGLQQHLPKAVGILTRGLAFCLVAEIANIAFGLGPLVKMLMRAMGM